MNNDWIDIKDRKPEEGEIVVAFSDYGGSVFKSIGYGYEHVTSKSIAQYKNDCFYIDGEEDTYVTHWLRLPVKDPTEERL